MGEPWIQFKNNNNTKQRGRRSRPKAEARQTGKEEPYAYTFKDPNAGEIQILNTANAWWIDQQKLTRLVDAYKFYATDDQACFYAGITLGQLRYFQEQHPDFFSIKHAAKQDPNLRAKKTIVKNIDSDKDTARWWLERTEKDTFNTRNEVTGAGGRDLYDGVTSQLKGLIEVLQNGDNESKATGEEHPSDNATGDANAGQDGLRNETTPTGNEPKGQTSDTSPSETI